MSSEWEEREGKQWVQRELAFPEPKTLRDSALSLSEPDVNFLAEVTRPEARRSRARINSWYEKSATATDSNFLNRLRDSANENHHTALDELLVDSLLQSLGDVSYEHGPGYPDFTVRIDDKHQVSLEVVSLFESATDRLLDRRMADLEDRVNQLFPARSSHFVLLEFEQIERTPSARRLAAFLSGEIVQSADHPEKEFEVTYREAGVCIHATLVRYSSDVDNSGGGHIVTSHGAGKIVDTGERLTNALRGKRADRYPEALGAPFALVAFLHDKFWSRFQIERAAFGSVAISVQGQRRFRMNNGFFKRQGEGFNRREIGAIFFIPPWSIWREERPEILRVDHPQPVHDFPDILAPDNRIERFVRPDGSMLMDWRIPWGGPS